MHATSERRNPWQLPVAGWVCLARLALTEPTSLRAADYLDHNALSGELKELAAAHHETLRVTPLATSLGRREIWVAELGRGSDEERRRRPGLLVVAGIEGTDLIGSATALEWIERLAAEGNGDSVSSLLDRVSVYIFPRANPDAAESYFRRPRMERTVNDAPTDADHDGLTDEDGPEDLNTDGLITAMRVESPEGEYILDPAEPRLLIKADKAKGERGAWKLLTEGIDNDKDERWNEDPVGGVDLNRNFPFKYEFFGADSGRHPVSEIETRALADFVVAHPNIGIVFTFGSADNLVQTPKSEPGGKRPPNAISESDEPYYKEMGRIYRETLGLKKELAGSNVPGSLSDWIYFHRGRLSLAARAWTPNLEAEIAQPAKADQGKAGGGGKESATSETTKSGTKSPAPGPANQEAKSAKDDAGAPADKRGEQERAALKWVTENAPEGFIPWKAITHPDFPNQRVEIGGWAPFAQNNPPARLLEAVTARHVKFLNALLGKLPQIGVRKTEAKHLGNGVYEIVVQVENTGYLPTALAQGNLTREVLPTRVTLKVEDGQILAGQRITLLDPIAGSGGMQELRFILRAKQSVELEVISALGGFVQRRIELKEGL